MILRSKVFLVVKANEKKLRMTANNVLLIIPFQVSSKMTLALIKA